MSELPFTAALTPEQVEKGEDINRANGWIRRAALMMLTKSQDEIVAMVRGDDEAAHSVLDLAEALTKYNERAQHEADLLKSAEARLWLVLGAEVERIETERGQ